MSILPPKLHTALTELLQALSSADNNARSQAEEQLNTEWVATQPGVLLMGLVEQVEVDGSHGQGHNAGVPLVVRTLQTRSFAAVLFRRIATKMRKLPGTDESKELFMTLQEAEKVEIRKKLLQCLQDETVPHVRNKVGDAVAEVARQYSDEGENWPELLGVLFRASRSPDAGQREGAFRIFATTPGIIEKQHEDTVLEAFTKGFKDEDVTVRISAMEAFASFFRSIQKKAQQRYYPLVPEILNILPPLKESGDSDSLIKALVALIELAEVAPKMFKQQFHNLVKFSITVIQDKDLGDQARQNALELMATFADYNAAMCRKDIDYTREMVTQCLSLMTDIGMDDDNADEWNASEDLDVEESDLNHVAGEQCLDRLANKLGGQAVLPPTFNWLPKMMISEAWRDRHAALMAISAISEGCRDLMVGELDQILSELVVPALKDPHPRVRWAGCNAIGQMSTDFAGTMQEKYHDIILKNIIPVLDSSKPRVQSHAAAALVNFCEEAEKDILEPYLGILLQKLLQLLRSPKRFVQEQALSTIATIADSAETAFGEYYSTLMPLLFNVLREEQSKEYRLLRAKAMECATLIALAVGKGKMGQDALVLVQLLGMIQQNITDADDPQSQYLLHCWGRMCRVLGQDFVPYLAGLLDDDEQVAQIEQEEGWELVPLKGKVIGIKTSILEDKHMAIELIAIYAQQLEVAFEPYVLEIMEKVALPGLAFFFHDPVRVASAKCVPMLLNSYKKAHGERSPPMAKLWELAIDKVLEVLSAEPAIDTLAEMYQCFYESVEVLGKDCLTATHMAAFIESAKSTLEDYQIRVKRRIEEHQETEDGEEESEETLFAIEDDQTLLSEMNKAFHTIFKNQGTSFLPSWSRLLPFYDRFITNQDSTQRQWALCIMDDVLEFCGEQSWNFHTHIAQPLADGMHDPVPANRQAACYGVGIAAQKGGAPWSDFVAESLPTLFGVCQLPNAREDDHIFATENACASIAKILQNNGSKVPNLQEVVAHWINTLPVVNDEEAAPYVYMFLAQLIEQQNPVVISAADKVFVAIALALEAETLQGATAQRVAAAANHLLQTAGRDPSRILATLTPETQHTSQACQSLATSTNSPRGHFKNVFWRADSDNHSPERGCALGPPSVETGSLIARIGTDSSQGKGQILSNINACLAVQATIRSTLGPYGGDLLLVDANGRQTITNDGATVMKLLDIVHPAARILTDIARSQDAEVGDGTTSVVVLAGEVLKEIRDHVEQGVSSQTIIKGLRRASAMAVNKIKEIAVNTSEGNKRETLRRLAATAMSSKLIHRNADFFTKMVVDAVLSLDQEDLNDKLIGIKKITGGALQDSLFVNGVAFKKTFSYAGFEQQPKTFKDPKIVCLNVELELKSEKDNAEVRVDQVSEYQAIVDAEWQIIYNKMEALYNTGAKIILSKLPIGDLATQYFADRDIFCAGRVSSGDLERVVQATGGSISSTCSDIQEQHLGTCGRFEERQIGGERFNFFEDCPAAKTCTLVLRGGAEQFIAEVERSLHDAIMIVKRAIKNQSIVAGGGACELEVSAFLHRYADKNVPHKQQAIIKSFAKALEIIPRQLCDNAGFDATDILNRLRVEHRKGNIWAGVDFDNEGVRNNLEAFVWEPSLVKVNAIQAAVEAACLILSVDETIKNQESEQPNAPQRGLPPGAAQRALRGRGRGMPRR
ncbi:MAG: hypothetical protein LQ347_002595 [Umbilicaria vellea]|nr:MAG: hypothetical protein LQ347_002595 [Umbilicaria vellea]